MRRLAEVVDYLTLSSEVAKDDDLVAVVIRSSGHEVFSSGADFSLVQNYINTPERGLLMSQFMTDALNRLRNMGLVSLCCVNGSALGGGAELITTTDFRIMKNEPKQFIQFLHAKLGASPGWGGARRLTEIIGRSQALRLLVAGQPISPTEALRIGLIDDLVNVSSPLTDADWRSLSLSFLAPYLAQPYPRSVRAIKRAVAGVESSFPEEAIAIEQASFYARWFSEDSMKAINHATRKIKRS